MTRTSDVIVIGGGVVGCSAAYYLSKAGLKVTVLERGEIAIGASGRNGTGARQSGRDPRELPLAMFGVRNIWPTLGEELGEDIEYVQNGNIRMGKTERDLKWCPTDGHANPMRTTLSLYKKARELGAQFIINIKVLKLEKVAGKIRRVYTDDGVFEADRVILCAGFGSRKILRTVGLDIPMLPQFTEAFITEPLPHITEKYLCAAGVSFYAQQQLNGTFLVGGDINYELYDCVYPKEVTFSYYAPQVARQFLEYMPTLAGAKIIRTWSGLLDMSCDDVATISPVEEVPGLYIGCGFSGHGFGIGPAAGYVLAQMAMDEEPAADVSALRYDRFRHPDH